jgi:hypothetical protein
MNNQGPDKNGRTKILILSFLLLVIYFIFFSIFYSQNTAFLFGAILVIFIVLPVALLAIAENPNLLYAKKPEIVQREKERTSSSESKSEGIPYTAVKDKPESCPVAPEQENVLIQVGNEEVSLSEIPYTYSPIPDDLFERACGIIVARHGSFPIKCRGIRIRENLVKAAMEILNSAPGQTLPQNCRNDTRENTPEGLDLRIKEFLDSDLRTANIITDVLESVGIASNVFVANPETGHSVKGTQLNPRWCWKPERIMSSPVNLSSVQGIKEEIMVYRHSLEKQPDDAGTWKTYEAALQRLRSLDTGEYNFENRRKDDLINMLSGSSGKSTSVRRKSRRISLDEVDSLMERKGS